MLEKINELPKLEESGSKPVDQKWLNLIMVRICGNLGTGFGITQLKRGLKGVSSKSERRTPTFYKERGLPTGPKR